MLNEPSALTPPIRKVFDLSAKMADPINLSIGQPDFDVPGEVRKAAIDAIESGNGYALDAGDAYFMARDSSSGSTPNTAIRTASCS